MVVGPSSAVASQGLDDVLVMDYLSYSLCNLACTLAAFTSHFFVCILDELACERSAG